LSPKITPTSLPTKLPTNPKTNSPTNIPTNSLSERSSSSPSSPPSPPPSNHTTNSPTNLLTKQTMDPTTSFATNPPTNLAPPPTEIPTQQPTTSPSMVPTQQPLSCNLNIEDEMYVLITTDVYGEETSWTLTKDCEGTVLYNGNGYSSNSKYETQACVPKVSLGSSYNFVINDSYNDGICCDFGNGGYSVSIGDKSFAGGSFTTSATHTFGPSCLSPTQSPPVETSSPTVPTTSPSTLPPAPTYAPTVGSTPTQIPTSNESPTPSSQPPPNNPPTKTPVTLEIDSPTNPNASTKLPTTTSTTSPQTTNLPGSTPITQMSQPLYVGELQQTSCFSPYVTVNVLGKSGTIRMKDVAVGDYVLTSGGQYQLVYTISHFHHSRLTEYLQIHTSSTGDNITDLPLEVSSMHMLFVVRDSNDNNNDSDKNNYSISIVDDNDTSVRLPSLQDPVPAYHIKIGDSIQSITGPRVVTNITTIQRRGLYNPITMDGTIVVDGIIASTYSSYTGTSHIEVTSDLLPSYYHYYYNSIVEKLIILLLSQKKEMFLQYNLGYNDSIEDLSKRQRTLLSISFHTIADMAYKPYRTYCTGSFASSLSPPSSWFHSKTSSLWWMNTANKQRCNQHEELAEVNRMMKSIYTHMWVGGLPSPLSSKQEVEAHQNKNSAVTVMKKMVVLITFLLFFGLIHFMIKCHLGIIIAITVSLIILNMYFVENKKRAITVIIKKEEAIYQ